MKCTIISGKSGSGKTGIMLERLNREKDNLVITNDPAVIYIEMYMARNNIPGRCVGINSLAKTIAQDIGLQTLKESTREVEIAIIGKIVNESNLSFFKENGYNSGLINKIHSFITECKEANVKPDDLLKVASKSVVSFEMKLNDIISIYKKYDEMLNEKGFLTKDDLVTFVASSLNDKTLSFPYVFIDTLDRYNKNTVALLEAIIPACEETCIAFNKTSKKAFDFDIYEEGMNAMIDVYNYIDTLDYCPVERIDAVSKKDLGNGLSIIEKELFNKDTETKSNADNVVLHQASSLYKEVDFLISNIDKLIKSGAKYSEILVTSSSMDRYINIISTAMKKHGIPYYYFKNTTVDKTYLFEFIDTILDVKINDVNSENMLKLCHLNFFNLTADEIVAVDNIFNRFGEDFVTAFQNGEKYDAGNTLIAKAVFQKIIGPIYTITDSPENVQEFLTDMYNYFEKIELKKTIVEKARKAEEEGYIHSSKEILSTWNSIMSIFSNMATIFSNDKLELTEIRDILTKMASEKMSNNSDLYHSQLTLLDMENAQNRKSKYLFIIGCNEGFMPKPVGTQIVSDREKIIINNEINSELKLSSVYQNYKNAAIYNTMILPQAKLFLTWSANDIDFKPLRYANIISNVVKTFEDNIVTEENFYDNDEEERFISLLENISLNRYKSIEKDDIDAEFMHFASHPKYNERLKNAIEKMENENTSFHSDRILDGYKEKEYFSVTRIERFNECPFKHYVDYALNPMKLKLFEETAADKGNYNHLVFKMFFDKCVNGEIDLIHITNEEYMAELDKIFEDVDKNHNESFLNTNCKNRYLSYTMKEKIKTSLWMAVLQVRAGTYEIFSNEYVVGKNVSLELQDNGETYHITGTIDRIDIHNDYARVIDYKSGNVEYSKEKMDAGIQLQLPLYSDAIKRDGDDISGMYYFRIKDFIADADEVNAPLKEFKLSGPTLNDVNILTANDSSLDSGVTSSVISADLTLKGEVSKKSKVVSAQEMSEIIENAEHIATDSIKKIKDGDTQANPLVVKDFDACKYCQYKCLCNIDRKLKDSIRKV